MQINLTFHALFDEIEEIFSMDPRLNLILKTKRVHATIGACIRPVTILTLSDLTISGVEQNFPSE